MNLNSVTPAVGESDKINAFCKSNSIINLIDSGLMYIGGGGLHVCCVLTVTLMYEILFLNIHTFS